jgi:hypothetical protein
MIECFACHQQVDEHDIAFWMQANPATGERSRPLCIWCEPTGKFLEARLAKTKPGVVITRDSPGGRAAKKLFESVLGHAIYLDADGIHLDAEGTIHVDGLDRPAS